MICEQSQLFLEVRQQRASHFQKGKIFLFANDREPAGSKFEINVVEVALCMGVSLVVRTTQTELILQVWHISSD